MSLLTMSVPSGWRRSRRRLGWALAFFVALCIWYSSDGILAGFRGDYLSAFVILGMVAGTLVPAVGGGFVWTGRVATRVACDSVGTTFLPDRRVRALTLSGFAMMIPPGIGYVIFVPRGEIAIPMSRGMQIFSPGIFGFATLLAGWGLVQARRRGVGYFKLLPTGIENSNIVTTKLLGWEDIVGVRDVAATSKAHNAIVLQLRDGTEEIIQGAGTYVPHGAALYWMVQHYFRHPDDRPELTDGRAVSRLRDGRFDTE